MGTGFLEVNIQPYRGWEGWAAPRRLHVWCVCLRVRLFPVPSSSTSQKAAAPGGGGLAQRPWEGGGGDLPPSNASGGGGGWVGLGWVG